MAGMYGCFKGRNSDSAAMASGPPDVMANQEPAEVVEECSGKKKSKFQTFKKFFARKKRKEPPAAGDAGLKSSQSIDNVSKTSENNMLTRSEKEKGSGSKISLGGKALSHDSVFVSDSSEANEALGASQDSIHGKVKSLQHQLRQAIRLGSPPSLICVKKTDDGGAMSEDDSLPCSPPECTTPHTTMNQAQRNSSISLEGADSDDDQLSCPASSRTVSPLVVPGDFSLPASPFACLDNSAAKHKLGLRHKACNKRKPVSRLELKAEGDSVVEEILNTSTAEAPGGEEQQKEITQAVNDGDLKPKVDQEEEEEVEEVEEEQPQHSRHSPSRDEEAEERADPDVSHGPDSSSPPEQRLSEEEDGQPSSRASSLDSPGATLEPPADPREYLLDPPGITYGAEEEKEVESDLALSGEEDGVQESRVEEEEESSFLQEVLSSLKTPLASCPLTTETEGVILELEEEAKETEREDIWVQEVEDVKEEEPPTGSFLSDQTTEEEEEVATLCQDAEEQEDVQDQEAATSVHVSQHDQEEEGEEEEVEKEDEQNDVKTGNAVNQAEEEEGREVKAKDSEEEEEEEEAIEQEVEEEGWEKREEEEVEETEEVEKAIEEETDNIEDVMETSAEAPGEEDAMQPPKEDEAVEAVAGDVSSQQEVNDDETESQDAAGQSFGEEKEEGEKEVEEGVKVERKSEQEEDREADQSEDGGTSHLDQSEQHVQQEDGGTSHLDQSEATDQDKVPSKPPPLSLPASQCETQPKDSGPITPSKTSTTTIHINLLSPSSKKAPPFFQQSLNATRPEENQMPCCAVEQNTEEEEAAADDVGAVEEEEGQRSGPPASIEVNQPTGDSAQSNTWLRSLSVGDAEEASNPPVSVPSSSSFVTEPASEEEEKEVVAEVKAESACPAKAEVVLSPSRVRSSGTPTTPSPSTIQPQASSAASTEESSVVLEGNPDNPFGVRLRKTSVLQRFSSEEENTELPIESPTQPTSCRVDSLQPSINQPVSNKPVIPKKPDVHGDSGGKNKRLSDPAAVRGVSGGSDSPSWISVAKQKQRIYKENSLDEITVRKEEPERKSSLPMYVSSAASRENSNRTAESTGKVSPLEIRKPSAAAEKEIRRALSPPTPVPPQPAKPNLPTTTAKPPSQPSSPQRSLSPPIPIPLKSPSCTSPPSPSKTPQSTTLTSPPFSSRTAPGKSGLRAPGLSSQTPASQRGLPPPALSQDEPPWMALAKKKAKAWSEMPQIVQ